MYLRFRLLALLLLLPSALLWSDPAPFDLVGPKMSVTVTRAGKTLPISAVPNLLAGDQIVIKTEFPKVQSAHYLMVAAFLRGATNPPPEDWFHSCETWNPKSCQGLTVTVPADALQMLVFLAPETGGDFRTLFNAVRGRPGAFVRASQDLNQATLDRQRLKIYLNSIRALSQESTDKLKTASPLLARSLAIKFNDDCMQKLPDQQAACLTQGQEALILNDGHSSSIVSSVTSGNSADLIMNLSNTPKANYGYYSSYIASVMDIARIMDSFHTAQYQYIPALATEQDDQMSLYLNTPPSFHNPLSVLVIALPAIQSPQLPPLRPVDPKEVYCAEKTELVLPVEGAPLAFATGYARSMVLRLKGKDGKTVDLPLKADAEKGGFLANTSALNPTGFGDDLTGSLHGYWGFDSYDGPEFHMLNTHSQHWQIIDDDLQALTAGQDVTLHLQTESAACVDSILLQKPSGAPTKATWKANQPNQLELSLSLKKVKPGPAKLLIRQYGSKEPDAIPLQIYTHAGHIDSFTLHAGDTWGVLKGSQLGDVREVDFKGVLFKTVGNPDEDATELTLTAADSKAAAALHADDSGEAIVHLQDGRQKHMDITVSAARPAATLIAKSPGLDAAEIAGTIQLTNPDEVPQGAVLTFSLHAVSPAAFSGQEKLEISSVQGASRALLSTGNGLSLEDTQIALATLDTGKAFSAFGALRYRLVVDGVSGNWQPLATLVRLPALKALQCPAAADKPCQISGSRLYLIDAVSADEQFTHPVEIPRGFPGYQIQVPRPLDGKLYVKLHDDPTVVNAIVFPDAPHTEQPQPAPAASAPTTPAVASPATSSPATAPTKEETPLKKLQ